MQDISSDNKGGRVPLSSARENTAGLVSSTHTNTYTQLYISTFIHYFQIKKGVQFSVSKMKCILLVTGFVIFVRLKKLVCKVF